MSELVKRPGFAITAEVLGYVSGGLVTLGALSEGGLAACFCLLLGGGLIAMSVLMRMGKNWARITETVLSGLVALCLLGAFIDENISADVAVGCCLGLGLFICEIVFSWLPPVNKWFAGLSSNGKKVGTVSPRRVSVHVPVTAGVAAQRRFPER